MAPDAPQAIATVVRKQKFECRPREPFGCDGKAMRNQTLYRVYFDPAESRNPAEPLVWFRLRKLLCRCP